MQNHTYRATSLDHVLAPARRLGRPAHWQLQRPSRPGGGCLSYASASSTFALYGSRITGTKGPWVVNAAGWRTCRRPPHRAAPGRRQLQCKAFSLPETVDATLRNILSISAVVGISYALLLAALSEPPSSSPQPPPLPPGAAPRALPPSPTTPAQPPQAVHGARNEDDNFVWGLMGFISILPLFNWLAWVLAAISDEDRAALYGIYAALYGSPLLLRGLDWQDPWVLFMLALCVVHVQAERVAQTEPEVLRAIQPVGAVGAALRGLVGGTGSLLAGLGGVLAEDSRRVVRRPGGRNRDIGGGAGADGPAQLGPGGERLQLDRDPDLVVPGREREVLLDPRRDPLRDPNMDLEDFSRRELREFDEELRRSERRRRQGPGGGAGGGGGGA